MAAAGPSASGRSSMENALAASAAQAGRCSSSSGRATQTRLNRRPARLDGEGFHEVKEGRFGPVQILEDNQQRPGPR